MFMITLAAARVNKGFKLKEVGRMVNMHLQTISKYEKDSSDIPYWLINELSIIYDIPKDNIFLGKSTNKSE